MLVFLFLFIPKLQAQAKNITIVIDPGHGGDNLGGLYEHFVEKELTMETAVAMKEYLEQFENVTVYLTHENITDQDMSLTKRAEFASKVDADFLFSLHYNKSADNRLFGAEVWVSAFDEYYAKGMEFAQFEMQQLIDYGLFDRGIKTRLNSLGTDYYGIIQHAREFDIPCVIIEHCHMDQENDIPYLTKDDACKIFGQLDAQAVAKYFKLKSNSLKEDYTSLASQQIPVPSNIMKPDLTPPDTVDIAIEDNEIQTDSITIHITANDTESGLNYYDYSVDGGNTFSQLQSWPYESSSCFFAIPLSDTNEQDVICRVYNRYDLFLTSNPIVIPKAEAIPETSELQTDESVDHNGNTNPSMQKEIEVISIPIKESTSSTDYMDYVIWFVLIFAVLFFIFNVLFILGIIKKRKKKKSIK